MRHQTIYKTEMHQSGTEPVAAIPMRVVGPVKIISTEFNADIPLPLATFESPLWPSTHRGARVCT
ncbi:MAG: hydroxymethylglutaryl-CoA reductase (NADPH), partial [uncultured bacterium]